MASSEENMNRYEVRERVGIRCPDSWWIWDNWMDDWTGERYEREDDAARRAFQLGIRLTVVEWD